MGIDARILALPERIITFFDYLSGSGYSELIYRL
jgi:hypothetical protein